VILQRRQLDGDALASLLRSDPQLDVVAVSTGDDAETLLQGNNRPDAAIIDIRMTLPNALPFGRRLIECDLVKRVLFLDDEPNEMRAAKVLAVDRMGYLSRLLSGRDLVAGIHQLLAGGTPVDPDAARGLQAQPEKLSATSRRIRIDQASVSSLTEQEVAVLRLLSNGTSTRRCAGELEIAENRLDHHLGRIMQKTRARNAFELVRFAIRTGLIEP
jgi:DNA-binding NarL/FixJ family response regulator